VLESTPSVADRVQGAHREEKWFGTAGVPNYFRRPFGPGWALVGDAGYDKDPITAQGISDAFIDAENLTNALDDSWSGHGPTDDVLAEYQSKRDRRAKPMYDFTCQLATLQPPPPLMQRLFATAWQSGCHEPVLLRDHWFESATSVHESGEPRPAHRECRGARVMHSHAVVVPS
jgi:2-polyprenyl-6-methoxyphenol hydroxylase-like FAD-dependent oxidoreductase